MNTALWVLLLLLLSGAGMTVGGVYMLAGPGWALLAGGAFALVLAGLLKRGMTDA